MATLFHNASVYDSTGRYLGDHVLVSSGRIVSLGKLGTPPLEGEWGLVDLGGRVVLPAFWDCHVHLVETGFATLGPTLDSISTAEEFLACIRQSADTSHGELVRVVGFDPALLKDGLPTLDQLDEVCPGRPLLLQHVEGHASWLNRRALALVGLHSDHGFVRGAENAQARQRLSGLISWQDRVRAITAAAGHLAGYGIAGVHAFEGGPLFHDADYDAVASLVHQLPLQVYLYHQVLDVDGPRARLARRAGGCVPLDGSSGVLTAAISEPYLGTTETGTLYYRQEEVDRFVERAGQLCIQTSLHACGDRAIEQVLLAHQRYPSPGLRHRVEHIEVPAPGQLERLAELGLVASVQPAFDHFWGGDEGDYALTLGRARARRANPLGQLLRLAVPVVMGSDSPVTPANPLLTLQAAVTHRQPGERTGFWQALPLITGRAAWAVHAGDERGDLASGKAADFVVFQQPPWDVREMQHLRPWMTVVNGRVVYSAGELTGPGPGLFPLRR
ncbi:MAG: amidohydrolase [Bacillota bacterium]